MTCGLAHTARRGASALIASVALFTVLPGPLLAQAAPEVTPTVHSVSEGTKAPTSSAISGSATATKTTESAAQSRQQPKRRTSARRTPVRTTRATTPVSTGWSSPKTASALAMDLGSVLGAHTRSGTWGVMVVSVTRGDTLFSSNPDVLLKPASIMKMMTTGLALERFGPSHTFATEVLRDKPVTGDVLEGSLYLRGGGDPTLSLRFWQGESPMDALARQIAAAGIKKVRGDIIADESAFATERIPLGWKTSYLMSAYAAPVSALSLNENVVWIVARAENGQPVVELDPPSSAIPITSTVRVVGGSGGRVVARRNNEGGITVTGTIGSRSAPRRYSLVVQEPPTFAAGALQASLRRAGVEVDGTIRPGIAPAGSERIAEIHSLPLAQMVSYMNRESINHFAELLYRNASRGENRQGSSPAGLAALREFLSSKAGTRATDVRVTDGSGLSEADSLTARAMVQLLGYAHKAPWGSVFHASMPVAGESELMRRRMRSTPAQGNLHAKTGTTNTVVSLAGYVTALNGEVLAFAFIYNGRDRGSARTTMDRMGPTLANFYRD
jgi:D-alanyl-D-alanine carboxypeptidase/D-alanyl-D-alanine-endopeptidase (penicillin-binding protein 4)